MPCGFWAACRPGSCLFFACAYVVIRRYYILFIYFQSYMCCNTLRITNKQIFPFYHLIHAVAMKIAAALINI